jgi:hypothetical protein
LAADYAGVAEALTKLITSEMQDKHIAALSIALVDD